MARSDKEMAGMKPELTPETIKSYSRQQLEGEINTALALIGLDTSQPAAARVAALKQLSDNLKSGTVAELGDPAELDIAGIDRELAQLETGK